MKELLSVIVPVYNSEKYIKKCVDSILAQTYLQVEIILVNDGSSDSSGVICDEYTEKYDHIKVVHKSNGGITSARLEGVRIAAGKYITFVDSDDWIDRDYYEILCREIRDCDFVTSGIYRYFTEEKCMEELPYYEEGIYDKDKINKEVIPNMLWSSDIGVWALDPSLCTKIFKKKWIQDELENAAAIGSNYGEDSLVIFPMVFKIEKFAVVNRAFYYHRQRETDSMPDYMKDELFLDKLHSVYSYLKNVFCEMGYSEIMRKQLEHFYFNSIELKKRCYGHLIYGFFSSFPFWSVEKNSEVILYGAGKLGQKYIKQNEEYHFCKITFWVDSNYRNMQDKGKEIVSPKIIQNAPYDYIVIAVDDYNAATQITHYLYNLNVPKEKIVWQSIRKCINKPE